MGIAELINECIQLGTEVASYLAMALSTLPPSSLRKVMDIAIPEERRSELRQACHKSGGVAEVMKKYEERNKDYVRKLSQLADYLEEEGFDLEKFKEQLTDEQFTWLQSHRKNIKRTLQGIEIL